MCWKYRLWEKFFNKPNYIPMFCVGCKYVKKNTCTKTKYRRKPCPNCGSKETRRVHILSNNLPFWWYIECPKCYWCGKTKLFLWRAVRSWNKEAKKVRSDG